MAQAAAIVERQEPQVPANVEQHPASDSTALIQMIERVALNPAIDIDKMERLLQMQERIMERNAKADYAAALAAMQEELPVITERGKIEVRAKDSKGERTGDVLQSTSYALWEDINEAIRPSLTKFGFALSFRTGVHTDGRIMVTGILSHRNGHQEETTMVLPHDSTGSKNAVQAVGSSTSYGKRYTASALLNITSRGEDDDGKAAGQSPGVSGVITEEQRVELEKLLKDAGAPVADFCAYAKIETLADLPAAKFDVAKQRIVNRKNGTTK